MVSTKILYKAETLDHSQRWTYMIGLGKDSLNDQTLTESLRELAASDIHYERILALMSAHGSFDKEIIVKLLEDPSVVGTGTAISLAAEHLNSDQLIEIIPRLSKSRRTRIAAALLTTSHTDIIELICTESDASIQEQLLLYTSEAFFKEHINQNQIEGFTEKQWRHMAKRFPTFTSEQIEKILNKSAEPSWLARQAVDGILRQFYITAPSMGLALMKKVFSLIYPKSGIVERYSLLFPEAVVEMILNQPISQSVNLPVSVVRKLKNEVLCTLAKRNILGNLLYVFPKLHPEQRAVVYKTIGEALRSENGSLPLSYVKVLNKQAREGEALHAFNLKLLEARPMERLPYLAVLSFTQSLPLATPFLAQPEGELRATAVSALVGCGRYYSSELDSILDFCLKRENEQDPVRLAMMTALADLPPTRWTATHLPNLSSIIAGALKARDCSYQTMAAAARMLLKMLTLQTDFVVAELPVLVERMGKLSVPSLESRITNADMIKLDACFYPLMKTWIARDRAHIAVSFIASFGCRIKSVYKQKTEKKLLGLISFKERKKLNLVQLLIDLTQDKRGHIAKLGLDTLIRLDIRDEVLRLIPKLLEQDSSWMQVNSVSQYLHRYRQNLLTPFLKSRVYNNRFSSGNTAILVSFDNGFARWTANQQSIYANSLNDILSSTRRNAWELYRCVSRLSAMPSGDLAPLIKLAQLDTKDIALRDKALEALGRADAGRGVVTLLQALNDNRARIAIYALRRSILNMPAKSALSLLAKAPRNKVTVEKEIIRLAGEFAGDDSYNFLRSLSNDENLHPDVQIALLRAFWKHLNIEEVWGYFNKAAQSGSVALARSTIRIPQEGLTQTARYHLCEQMTLLLKNENAQVRMETLERLVSMPIGQADDAMFEALAEMLEDIDVNICRLAAEAMLSGYISKIDNKLVETFAKVNRPKSVSAVVDAFQDLNYVNITKLRNCAESLSYAILKQRRFPTQALRLTVSLLPPSKIRLIICEMAKTDLLHPGAIEANLNNWNKAIKTYPQDDIDELEMRLRTSQNEKLRRLGLGVLIESSSQRGWTKERCEWILEYCADSNLWISEAAGMIDSPQALERDSHV